MASISETGHTKNVSNFGSLITYCTGFGSDYNPSNSNIKLTILTTYHTDCKTSLKLVKTTETHLAILKDKDN